LSGRPTYVALASLLLAHITSPAKPEVNNLSQRHQGMTELRSRATSAENLEKFVFAVCEICQQISKQTDNQTYGQTRSSLHISEKLEQKLQNVMIVFRNEKWHERLHNMLMLSPSYWLSNSTTSVNQNYTDYPICYF